MSLQVLASLGSAVVGGSQQGMALAAEPEASVPAARGDAPEASSAGSGAHELGSPLGAGASSGTAPTLSNGVASPADAVASSGASTEPDQAVSPGGTGGGAAGRAPGGEGLAAVEARAGGKSEPDTTPCIVSSADGGATAARGEGGGRAAAGAAHAAPEGAAAAPGGAAAAEAAAGAAPAAREGGTLAERLAQQVEFYFSDANLPTDAFMLKQLARSPEGWGAPWPGERPRRAAPPLPRVPQGRSRLACVAGSTAGCPLDAPRLPAAPASGEQRMQQEPFV